MADVIDYVVRQTEIRFGCSYDIDEPISGSIIEYLVWSLDIPGHAKCRCEANCSDVNLWVVVDSDCSVRSWQEYRFIPTRKLNFKRTCVFDIDAKDEGLIVTRQKPAEYAEVRALDITIHGDGTADKDTYDVYGYLYANLDISGLAKEIHDWIAMVKAAHATPVKELRRQ